MASSPVPPEYIAWNLPAWAHLALQQGGYLDRFDLFTELNPYYVAGLFDEDSLPDLAIQVREKSGGRRGILILHRGTGQIHVFGAGQPFGNGGDDWSWLWEWRVADAAEFEATGRRGHQGLLVAKPESASGYLWWDGSQYHWSQGAD